MTTVVILATHPRAPENGGFVEIVKPWFRFGAPAVTRASSATNPGT
jgi:hypothetical protein